MKLKIAIICGMFALAACNNNKEADKYKAIAERDSIALANAQGKDTVIAGYVNALGEIQDNLDSLKMKEKILSMKSSEGGGRTKQSIIADIKAIDAAIIANNKKINQLQSIIRKMKSQDAGFKKMIVRLNREIGAKDSEIALYQNRLLLSNDSLRVLTHQYNDTITEIQHQRSRYNNLNAQYNSVYYAVGTMKDLKDKGLISKKGGLLGIGKTSELNSEASNAAFTKGDMSHLDMIPLNARVSKVITTHPADSYRLTKNKDMDTLYITNGASFWSESKYLVVQVK